MRLFLKPLDVIMFRDSRAFTAGEDVIAKSIIPPPQTFAGALRSKIYLSNTNDEQIKKLIGYNEEEPRFTVYGSFLAHNGTELFFKPKNIKRYLTHDDKEKLDVVFPVELNWNGSEKAVLVGESFHHKGGKPYFFTAEAIKTFLNGELTNETLERIMSRHIILQNQIFEREERIGIALEHSKKTTREGLLYRVEFMRFMEGFGFSVWTGDEISEYFDEEGYLKIGGENRIVSYTKGSSQLNIGINATEISEQINETKTMCVYIATHTIIKNDSVYTYDISKELEHMLNIKITRLMPVAEKLQLISGWDIVKKRPKRGVYAVPPGSVYFVRFEGNIELEEYYAKIGLLKNLGFGLIFFGIWR